MKFTSVMCFTHLSWLQRQNEFLRAVSKVAYSRPEFEFEGMSGYIETKVEFEVLDIVLFAKVYNDFYSVSHEYMMKIRNELINGNKSCK